MRKPRRDSPNISENIFSLVDNTATQLFTIHKGMRGVRISVKNFLRCTTAVVDPS